MLLEHHILAASNKEAGKWTWGPKAFGYPDLKACIAEQESEKKSSLQRHLDYIWSDDDWDGGLDGVEEMGILCPEKGE